MIKTKSHTEIEMRIPSHLKRTASFHNSEGTIYLDSVPEFEQEIDHIDTVFGESRRIELMALIEGMYSVYRSHAVSYDSVLGSYGTEVVKLFYIDQENIKVVIEYLGSPDDNDDDIITISWDK